MNWNRMSLFKLPNKHKRFDYIPRYYDPRKEELDKKIEQAKNATDQEGNYQRKISFRQKTADKWGNPEFKRQTMRSNVRLIVIFAIVLMSTYFLFIGLDHIAPFLDNATGK